MLQESAIIQFLKQAVGPLPSQFVGIGDDAAVIPINHEASFVVTKDILAEDRHFRLRYASPQDIAHKALHINMSDLAAMGAQARYAFLALSLPVDLSPNWVYDFLQTFTTLCHHHKIFLLGGDTIASDHGLLISITLMAQEPLSHLKYRTGAQCGNIIALVGALGDASAGLTLLEEEKPGFPELKRCALRPQAKILEGVWLGQQQAITSMIDISDGLYIDLNRLCKASKVGAEIDLLTLRPSSYLKQVCQDFHGDIFQYMLTGGEDYGLLCTIDDLQYQRVTQEFSHHFGNDLYPIGVITSDKEIKLMKEGRLHPLTWPSFSHFSEREDDLLSKCRHF